jgi:hypothetical protein
MPSGWLEGLDISARLGSAEIPKREAGGGLRYRMNIAPAGRCYSSLDSVDLPSQRVMTAVCRL